MDPFTIITGVAGLLSFLGDGIDYVNSVASASGDRRALVERLYRLQDELQSIYSRVNDINNAKKQVLVEAFGREKTDSKLFRRYEEVARPGGRWDMLYDKAYLLLQHDLRERGKIGKMAQSLKWKWSQGGLNSKVDEVVAMARTLREYLSDDDAQTGVEILSDVKQIKRMGDEAERIQILNWISPGGRQPTDFVASKHSSIKAIPDPFTSTVVYKQWVKDAGSRNWHLSCYGKPGCGKSHRSRTIIWDLSKKFQSQGIPVLWVMFNHQDRSQQSLASIYSTLLRQLLSQTVKEELSSEIRDTWDRGRRDGALCPTESEARALLMQELKKHPIKFIVADALDEAGESSGSIHTALTRLRIEGKACIFTTSRDVTRDVYDEERFCNGCSSRILDISWECDLCPAPKGKFEFCAKCYQKTNTCPPGHQLKVPERIYLEVFPSTQEIEIFVKRSLEQELDLNDNGYGDQNLHTHFVPRLQEIKDGLGPRWASVPTEISVAAANSYLIADLITKRIVAQVQTEDAERILDGLLENSGTSWDAEYDEMLGLCLTGDDPEGQNIAYKYLAFMSRARDTLSFEQLRHAIAVKEGDKNSERFPKRSSRVETVRRLTRGLLTIGDFGNPNDLMVSFSHRTLADYLDRHGSRWFPDADQAIFDACLAYLRLDVFEKPFEKLKDLDDTLTRYPFASYAACHWCEHLCSKQPAQEDSIAVLEMLNDQYRTKAIIQIAQNTFSRAGYAWDASTSLGPLHICAFHGLKDLCRMLIDDGENLNQQEIDYGQTPLHYAARRGHSTIVKLLLDAGANANIVSRRGHGFTPLMETVENDHVDAMSVLLSYRSVDVNLDCGGIAGKTALVLAAQAGKDVVVAQLLGRSDIDINKPDGGNNSALTRAFRQFSVGCVKLILQHPDVNVNIQDGRMGTPLTYTSYGRPLPHQLPRLVEIVQLFLKHPACEPVSGLCLAMLIQKSLNKFVSMFLNHGNYKTWREDNGRTLMHIAAYVGNVESLNLVYDHMYQGSSSVLSSEDQYGNTPLHWACMTFGKPGASDMSVYLLAKGANPLAINAAKETPLDLAYQNSPQLTPQQVFEVFKPYLPDGVTVIRDRPQPTLRQLLMSQDKKGVELFLQRAPQSIAWEREPDTGWTPLHRLVSGRHRDLLELILPRVAQDVDTRSYSQSTPLHLAARTRFTAGIELLLRFGADMDLKDEHGDTAFEIAQRYQRDDRAPALMLINAGSVLPALEYIEKDLLWSAVTAKDIGAVKRLTDAGVDIYHRRNPGERTVFDMAREVHKIERGRATNETSTDPTLGLNIDKPSFWKLVDEAPKVKSSRAVFEVLQEAAAKRKFSNTRRAAGVKHRDLSPLLQRLKKEVGQGATGKVPDVGQTSARDRSAAEGGVNGPSSHESKVEADNVTSVNRGGGNGISKEERIAVIVMVGVVAIAWIWLNLHYQAAASSGQPRKSQEL